MREKDPKETLQKRPYAAPALVLHENLGTVADTGPIDTGDPVVSLYRNSASKQELRIHVATFAVDGDEALYSQLCEYAQALCQIEAKSGLKYWCERGRSRLD